MKSIGVVKEVLGSLTHGELQTAGGLTLLPLFGSRAVPDYVLAEQALGAGALRIEEMGGGDVPNIVAHNLGPAPVLLVDGEHLEGAKQNRIINISVLLAPMLKTVLPVSCVEQGRWRYSGDAMFASSPDHTYARLRGKQAAQTVAAARSGRERRAEQGMVWDDVALKHQETGVRHSRSGAMRDSFDNHRSTLLEVQRVFAEPKPNQTGVVAFVDGRPIAVDLFDKPATLGRLWTRLISGYAIDALGHGPGFVSPERISGFLSDLGTANFAEHGAIGLGTDVTLRSGRAIGTGVVWEAGVVHLAAFPANGEPDRGPGPRFSSARQRSRRHFHEN